jgi:hypothetical protein
MVATRWKGRRCFILFLRLRHGQRSRRRRRPNRRTRRRSLLGNASAYRILTLFTPELTARPAASNAAAAGLLPIGNAGGAGGASYVSSCAGGGGGTVRGGGPVEELEEALYTSNKRSTAGSYKFRRNSQLVRQRASLLPQDSGPSAMTDYYTRPPALVWAGVTSYSAHSAASLAEAEAAAGEGHSPVPRDPQSVRRAAVSSSAAGEPTGVRDEIVPEEEEAVGGSRGLSLDGMGGPVVVRDV